MTLFAHVVASLVLTGAVAWDYMRNGADWKSEGMCGKGGAQSPINLPTVAPTAEEDLTMFLKYPRLDTSMTVYHNGNSIALTMPETFRGGFGLGKGSDGITPFESEDGVAYRLWQVNFHSPSEHTINGERLPLEMQLMHQQVTGGQGLAVVVVLFSSAPNAYGVLLDSILGSTLPRKPWEETVRKPPFEFASVLGGSPYYSYEGSLTVPPCEQQVKYFVRKDPVPAAHAQLRAFSKVLEDTCRPKGNYRLLQHLSGPVTLVGTVDLETAHANTIRPAKQTLQAEQVSPGDRGALPPAVNTKCFDDAKKDIHRVKVGESEKMIRAKTDAANALRELSATQSNIGGGERSVNNLQRMYDTTEGIVQKIELKWQLTAAQQLRDAARMNLPKKERAVDKASEAVIRTIIEECVEQGPQHTAVVPLTKKATRHWEYAKPNVKLPHGLGGSPFSKYRPQLAGEEVVISSKIAVNLKQPDGPLGASPLEAVGKAYSAMRGGSPDTVLALRLPIAPNATGDAPTFTGNLMKALAKVGHIAESRLEFKEIREVTVPTVHVFTAPKKALVQLKGKELPRGNLRHAI